ncbi:LysR family transcriptional regulator [Cryptosporangium sp. NPDC048952]
MSAQPFGQRIKQLERELGFALFTRSSRRVALTSKGELFSF